MNRQPLHLELYTRPGCHLCEELRVLCERLGGEFPLQLTEVNIEADPTLLARYEEEIPVLFIEGRRAVKYRTTETALRYLFQRRLLRRRFFGT
jgi:glutaredoxin